MKASTVSDRKRLGNSSMCGAALIRPMPEASEIILPHEMTGGCRPMPRKDSVASTEMKTPRLMVETTITEATELGRMWEVMIRQGEAPERPGGLHVVVRLDLEHAGAHQPRDRGPGKDRDDESDLAYGDREWGVDLVGEREEEQEPPSSIGIAKKISPIRPITESSQPPR